MWLKISVTREDINRGEMRDEFHCPIARAFRRTGYKVGVSISGLDFYYVRFCPYVREQFKKMENKFFEYIPTPELVKDWIRDFDDGKASYPFEFYVELKG